MSFLPMCCCVSRPWTAPCNFANVDGRWVFVPRLTSRFSDIILCIVRVGVPVYSVPTDTLSRRSLLPSDTLQGPQRRCMCLRQATLALLPIPSAFTKVVFIAFYSRTTCSRLSLKHVCLCSRFCAVRWYTCGRGTDVFVDLCHHHLQICVCVISCRGRRRRFTAGFVLQLHLHNMEVTRDPFHSVSENDDDGELTSRRMRLFPDCGWLTCVFPCLCIVGMLYSTYFWLFVLLCRLVIFPSRQSPALFAWGSRCTRVSPGGHFHVGSPAGGAWLRSAYCLRSCRSCGCGCVHLGCERIYKQACEEGDVKSCQLESRCEALVPLSNVVCILVVLSWFVLVGFYLRHQVESRRQRVELKAAKIRWVKVNSFKKWNGQRMCIPRFQDLEEHDYVEGCEAWSFTAWLLGTRHVVSHAWTRQNSPTSIACS